MSIIGYILTFFFFYFLISHLITHENKKETIENKVEEIEEKKETLVIENKPINQNIKQYKIAGVTFENEDGKDIQKEIKKILKEYVEEGIIEKEDMFLGYTNSEIKEMDLMRN